MVSDQEYARHVVTYRREMEALIAQSQKAGKALTVIIGDLKEAPGAPKNAWKRYRKADRAWQSLLAGIDAMARVFD